MMKHYISMLILAIGFSSCGEQPTEVKNDTVQVSEIGPVKEFVPRGELVTEYEQVYLQSNDRRWVEVYLYVSKDSIIETEVERLSKESTEAPAIYCFLASREQLDFSTLNFEQYKIKEPEGMKKVSIEVKDKSVKVKQWISDPRSGVNADTIQVTGIRVLVKDEAQAKEIMEKLKTDR